MFLSVLALSFAPINPPAPSVVTELRCNEGSGTIVNDGSGNAHNGTLTNGPTWVAGKDGQAVNLDGTNDYINIPDHADYTLTPTVSYTWSAWIKNNNFNQWSTVWSQTLNATNFFYFYAHTSSDAEAGPVTNGITVYWYSGSSKLVLHSNNNVLTAGAWSYITVTYDASKTQASRFTIYVNGNDVTNRSDVVSSGTIATIDPANIRIGSNQPYGEYLNGAVDEIRYYRRLLSLSEIQADMNIANSPLPDVTAPTVSITAPSAGNVSGTINVTATATDNIGVSGVQFLLDGNNLNSEDLTAPYSVSWNTTAIANGNHTLTARARDAAGNTTTSTAVTVNVNNGDATPPAVSMTAPVTGNVSGTINVTATATDNVGVAGVQFLLDGNNLGSEDISAPYSISWNTTTIANGNHSLAARARDAAGNTTTSTAVTVNVNNSDATPPVVTITGPAAGNVSGTINVTATATDNVGVAGVQFLLDGNNLGSEDLSAPYSISWNTTTTANGNHSLTARARDAAGNITASSAITVTVNNDVTAPTVSVNGPLSSPVSGTITVSGVANDNVGVVGVQFLLDGGNLGSEDVTAPYSVSWNTTTATNGNHNITARARDAAGNTTTSAIVVFNVSNSGLVAAYGFNENSGTVVNDNSGNGNNGTLTNGPSWSASGKYGSAISFDGTNDYINVSDANSLDLTNRMTVEAWVYATNLTGYKTAICKENGSSNLAYALSPNNSTSGSSNQRPNTRIRIGSSTSTVTGTNKLSANTWTHLASTYDGSVLRLYVNGVLASSTNVTGNISVTTNPLRIGGSTALSQYFMGMIDEVRIYNRALSQSEIQADMNAPIAPDVTAPTVSIIAPPPGDISGTLNVVANASDNIAVVGVQFFLDGINLGSEDLTAPYSFTWNTTMTQNGSHTLTARARDAAGNVATSPNLIVNVNNDHVAPTVHITAPAAGTIAGTIDITADASDNTGVAGVQFLLNGVNLGAEDLSAPYSFTWNTTTLPDGSYSLTAKARDTSGNMTTSTAVVVNILNHPPDTEFPTIGINAPAAGEVLGTINVTATATDNVGIVGVQFLVNGNNLGAEDVTAPYSVSWNTTSLANGAYTLTARTRDAAGNTTISADVLVNVNNPADAELPVIAITAPVAGNVSGTINITANASDNVGVVGVTFLLDGNPIGTEDMTAPYSISWNTITASNGQHTLTSTARDAEGNIGTSASVIVNISNDLTAPTVNITSPAAGNVSGTITITANATDNVAVVGVQFLLDGVNLGVEDLSAPYSVSWNTLTATNGLHTLTANARDAAGNLGTSTNVSVTVNNDLTAPTVSITSPGAGNVSGTINVNANASDNVGVVGVQFLLDGVNLGTEDLSAPYSVSWNTLAATNGQHNLTAKARDAAGNIMTSVAIAVTVNNVTNLITAIHFNEGNGTTAADVSGKSHNGTLTGGATWTTGKFGQAVNLNGSNNYVNIADHTDYTLNPAQSYTWSAWVKNNSFKEWSTVWSQAFNTSNFFYFYAHTTSQNDGGAGPVTNGISVYWTTGNNKVALHSNNNVLTAGQWSHVTVTYDASQSQANRFSIYVNGVDVTNRGAVGSTGTITSIDPTGIRIGSNSPFGEYLNGAVDEVRFYNRLLTAAEIQNDMNTPIGIDNTAPTVNVSGPSNNSFAAGTINITANASDNVSVAGVQFLLDGNNLGAEDVSSPYSISWSTTTASNGIHTLTASARDAAGNTTTSAAITVTVDNVFPSGSLTAPTAGIVKDSVDVMANGTDNNSVAGVQFLLNGANLGNEDLAAPYSFRWNTADVADGNYTLTAKIRDVAGNITTTAAVAVNVINHPPDTEFPTVSLASPAAGEVIGTINITATANDNTGVVGVQFLLNGTNLGAEELTAPYALSWNTSSLPNGDYTLTARARDAAGNITTSGAVVVTVNNPPDTESPTVNLTAPVTGNVSGTITVAANATDNAAVVGVQFLLDGENLGAEDLVAPYSISWNTKLLPNGNYTITARARDAAGNINVSADVVTTIDNDLTSPSVAISSPGGGNVSGMINVTADASDNVGVTGVQFLMDGNNLGAEDLIAPYTISWNTTTISNGNHILTARAKDAAGNITTSAPINVTVANINPVISAIAVSSITESSAVITWTTSFGATSQVNYGTTVSYGSSTLVDSALVTSHSMILNNLAPGTLYHYQVLSGNSGGSPTVSGDNVFTTAGLAANLGTLNTHTVFAYPAGKIVPWTPNPSDGYNTVVNLAWNYLLTAVPNDPLTGKPAYYSRSYLDPNTQQVVNWDHNPAGLYSMLIESGLKYYAYSGNANVMQLAIDVATWHLDHGMTLATDSWANVPYSEGPYGSLTYNGANTADGVGNLEPDKIGELGYGMLQLYKFTGNTRFRDAAIQFANVLAAKVRTGSQTQSPWPHRVRANNGSSVEDYGADVIGPVSLFDGLIAAGLGNTAAYQAARTTAWNWMMTYPMQNNVWSQYFEDVGVQGNYNSNLNQYNAMMTARYLLEHPEFDVNWEAHVRGLITWVETTFGQTSFGATAIKEQQVFPWIMGSHTSRYASVNALLYEKTGDLVAKEKAYRSFNWATYMARSNGVVIDGPDVNNQWFTDGYGDYIRHFMTGMGAVPEWSPATQTHMVRSNSVIRSITYGVNTLSYTTFNSSSTEVLHISYNPVTITVDGVELARRSDLSQPGWTLDVATKTLKIYHTSGTTVVINPGAGSRILTQTGPTTDSVGITGSKTPVRDLRSAVKDQMSAVGYEMQKPNRDTEARLVILPNPAKGNFSLDYSTPVNGKATIRVHDVEGKLVFTVDRGVSAGHNIIPVQGHSSWRAGVYFITVQQGDMVERKKLVYQ